MKVLRAAAVVALLSAVAEAQPPPQFEVASIRPSAEQQLGQASIGIHISGSQVRVAGLTLRDYVAMAYRLPANQVTGPDWMTQVRFDVAAKVPDGATMNQVPEMFQALLAERFELKTHRDSKVFPVFALVAAKGGARVKEHVATDDPQGAAGTINVAAAGSSNGVAVDLGGGSSFSLGANRLEITKATMEQVVTTLTRVMDRPVVDETGLKGIYDLTLDLTPEDYTATLIRSAVNAGVSLPPQALRVLDMAPGDPFSAPLQKYGLTLDSRKSPLDVIVVDSARKTPIEN